MATTTQTSFKLKPLSRAAIPAALEKAEQYRLLNQPHFAESICLDILDIDSGNQKALVTLLLALTDQFGQSSSRVAKEAQDIANKLKDKYEQLYYTGIIHERQGNSALASDLPGSEFDAYEWYLEAMEFYEKADAIHPEGNNDPILRWNTCVRTIEQYSLKQRPFDSTVSTLE